MSTSVAIVQARMTSTRLPGKVLMELAGATVLRRVLDRCAAIPGIDSVCCAIPDGNSHDPIADEAVRAGASVFRGSEVDVLARYAGAARACGADVVMRVTSDCPLIDPAVCGRVLTLLRNSRADYACNNMPASWPHGLDCEAFTSAALFLAAAKATTQYEREHVTPWLRENPDIVRVNLNGPGGWAAEQRLTLDFPEDFSFLQAVFTALPDFGGSHSSDAILNLLRARPDIAAINSQHHNVSRPSTPTIQETP